MGTKPFPRNERCPCGSGQKYKHCCFQKGFTYQLDDQTGEVIRAVPLTRDALSELEKAVAAQSEKFIAKFGRARGGPPAPPPRCSRRRGRPPCPPGRRPAG